MYETLRQTASQHWHTTSGNWTDLKKMFRDFRNHLIWDQTTDDHNDPSEDQSLFILLPNKHDVIEELCSITQSINQSKTLFRITVCRIYVYPSVQDKTSSALENYIWITNLPLKAASFLYNFFSLCHLFR